MLVNANLSNIAEGRVEWEFQEALRKVISAYEEELLDGKCTITIALDFSKKEGSPWVNMTSTVKTSTPNRKQSSVLALKEGSFRVETTSDNAQEPGLFEDDGEDDAAQVHKIGRL